MDTSQWSQVSTATNISNTTTTRPQQVQSQQLVEDQRKITRPLKEQALNCPRCNSTNTKFCYYNNYSLTQPRYFCKSCKRYWTQGGSLRNVPVGGGSRKNKKHSSSSTSTSSKIIGLHPLNSNPNTNPIIISPPSMLSSSNLAKPNQVQELNMNLIGGATNGNNNSFSGGGLSAMELLRSTTTSATSMYGGSGGGGGGFGLHDFSSPSSIVNGIQENGGRLLFPFEDHLKELSMNSSNESDQQNIWQGGNPPMFWSTSANLGGSGGSW